MNFWWFIDRRCRRRCRWLDSNRKWSDSQIISLLLGQDKPSDNVAYHSTWNFCCIINSLSLASIQSTNWILLCRVNALIFPSCEQFIQLAGDTITQHFLFFVYLLIDSNDLQCHRWNCCSKWSNLNYYATFISTCVWQTFDERRKLQSTNSEILMIYKLSAVLWP